MCTEDADLRCQPTMWIFNISKGNKLCPVVGVCLYLMKMLIYDKYDTVSNAKFWNRQLGAENLQKYIYGND